MRWAATSKRRCGASSPSRRSRSTTNRAGTRIERAAHCCPPRTARAMTVYVDDAVTLWRGHRWAHLMADTLDELHDFAARLGIPRRRSEEHTSELQSLMRISYAVLFLQKKNTNTETY